MFDEHYKLNIEPPNEPHENKPVKENEEKPEQVEVKDEPNVKKMPAEKPEMSEKISPEKTSITDVIKRTFQLYFRKPLMFSGLYAIVMVPATILQTFFLASVIAELYFNMLFGSLESFTGMSLFLILIYFAISFISGVLTLGGTIRIADNFYEGRVVKLFEGLAYAFKKAGSYLLLALRVFWYSLAWLYLLAMIALPMMLTIFRAGRMPGIVSLNTAFAQLIQSGDLPPSIAQGSVPSGPDPLQGVMMIIIQLLPVILIALAVLIVIRLVKVVFSFYILFDEEKITSKEALNKSKELAKGNFWRIIGYTIIIFIILYVISFILAYLFGTILNMIDYGNTYIIMSFIFSLIQGAIIFPIPIIYYFLFYKGVRKEKGLPDITHHA